MDAEKKYIARCYLTATAGGAKIIQHEALFSTHEAALRYLVLRASGHTLEDDSQMEIIEFVVDIADGREAATEWQYDANARLLWCSLDEAPAADPHEETADVALLEGTVVRLLAWPWCVESDLPKEQIGVVESVYEDEEDEAAGFQYTVAYINEFGLLDRAHPRSEKALVAVEGHGWKEDAALVILSEWARGKQEIPADVLQDLEEGAACARCLETLVD